MVSSGRRKGIRQGLELKIVIVVVAIVACVVGLIVQRKHELSSGTGVVEEETMQGIRNEVGKLPPSDTKQSARPFYPMDKRPNYEEPAGAPMSGQTKTARIPGNPSNITKTEEFPLPSSPTQVHSLAEAGEVMGTPSSEVGQIGVTRSYRLPGQTPDGSNGVVPGNSIEMPPDMPSSDIGRSKNHPLPKDAK
jgi:hypothetical protein